ncbi:hypothetical protein A2763_04570 [Candidatus Kaiserbacteria bacterium RIFCSPHIGHO2_01_FULL_54_36]|uniref:HicB-like antitoxin of toxin-antitoxin system domain-containing protein n=1 Tax=Candidatus Kaiserbacteria bacterium RIFCSPHIGHO2_01_FULL_54_36 TaxID=1798482 RepID=A0A1F6CLV1_9BACT|nr:MAG: hypothetical protein A2763_04570 [Candidatus Kaiserbacteria bacterium RIFCSPHIGHO2_01_FULL_54_36]OGG75042.1 MAG: hypothetical protein A3A41_02000 [Candidatus Kaiserbacteria bacterium RIFCSPLOWO2_01_FULL_54_22]
MKAAKRQFKIVIERDEDGYFIADIPALPGCHTQAKTMEELKKNVREVIALCLAESKANPAYRRQIREFSYEPSFVGIDTVIV